MNIGIDFDNTITQYVTSFREVALEEGIIDGNWECKGKTELRDHLRRKPNGEKIWMKLQGLVYGKYMYRAEMLPGVANFLMSCKRRNHKLFIVSHKTEYGHFDPARISLRQEALKWMEARKFFDQNYFGIERENIFFADTREEKVKKISQLKCDWFIDDLPEVFEEKNFPQDTKKILFTKSDRNKIDSDISLLDNWSEISDVVLGYTTDEDVILWVNKMAGKIIEKIEKITGRGNSKVYKAIASDGNSYLLKHYPKQTEGSRPRLETEFNALRLLHHHNFKNVPKAFGNDINLNLGLYDWIDGEKVSSPGNNDLDQAIDFIENLYSLSQKIDRNDIGLASEACLSVKDFVSQIEKRLLRLKLVSKSFPELSTFLENTFEPLWAEVKYEIIPIWHFESRDYILPRKKQTLSPSDFGFHNCIKLNDGSLKFIDFDYFGWDDPVKLTADFIWHPAMNLNRGLTDKWKIAMLNIFSSDSQFENRLNGAIPLYGLRWALIILNEFLPGFADRRKAAGETGMYNIDKIRRIQLKKSQYYCEKVKIMITQVTFA